MVTPPCRHSVATTLTGIRIQISLLHFLVLYSIATTLTNHARRNKLKSKSSLASKNLYKEKFAVSCLSCTKPEYAAFVHPNVQNSQVLELSMYWQKTR